MDTSIQNYFWLVDRLAMEDDPRNKVNADNETVTLSEDLQAAIQDGPIFAKLLSVMHRTYTMRTSQSFELPAQPLTGTRDENWDMLIPQMRHFGIKINDARTKRLQSGDPQQLKSLLTTLFEIDTSPIPKRQGSQASFIETNESGAESSRGGNGSLSQIALEPIDHSQLQQKQQQVSRQRDNLKTEADNITTQRQQALQDIMMSAQRSQSPQADGSSAIQRRKTSTVRQSIKSTYTRIGGSNAENLEIPESLDDTLTSAQFIIKSLMVSFDMTSKQVVGLLSDNHHYLYHLCIKGLKGGEFTQVHQWYELVAVHAPHLVSLLEMETQNQAGQKKPPLTVGRNKGNTSTQPLAPPTKTLMKTLNIFKGGLYSKDEKVAVGCIQLFQAVILELNLCGGDIVGQTWDWLTLPTEIVQDTSNTVRQRSRQPSQKSGPSLPSKSPVSSSRKPPRENSASAIKKGSKKKAPEPEPVEKNEFLETVQQPGLQGVIRAFNSFDEVKASASYLLLHFGKFNAVELFTEKILQLHESWSDYAIFSMNIFNVTHQSELGQETLEMTGVLSFWVLQSLKVSESSGDVTLDDRISSLVFFTEIWLNRTDYIDTVIEGSGPAVLNILKRAARDVKQTLAIIAIELMFRILESFARVKHSVAPTLYKTLTFILVEFYWEIEIRDMMLKHFIYLFKKLDNIPIAILCEPLLKQVQISQYHTTSFNVFDFEFFQVVAYHKKLNIQSSLLLLDALTKIALSSVFYATVALQTLKTIIMRFSKQPEMFTHWKESFRQMLISLVNFETTLTQHYIAAKEDKGVFFNRLSQQTRGRRQTKKIRGRQVSADFRLAEAEVIAIQTNQRLLVNVLEKIILLGNDLLNEELRLQLIDSYIACENTLEIKSKPIKFLLSKYGFDVDAMISHKLNVPEDIHNLEDDQAILLEESKSPIRNQQSLEQNANKLSIGAVMPKSRSVSKSPNRKDDIQSRALFGLKKQVKNERKIETANIGLIKSTSRAKIAQKTKQLNNYQSDASKPNLVKHPRSTSNIIANHQLKLYDYQSTESATNILRYRHFTKRHLKLYKEIFVRYEGNNTRSSRVPKSQQTFDAQKKSNQVISGTNLMRMIKDMDLMPAAGGFVTTLRLRQDIPLIIKLINQLPNFGDTFTTKLPELNFDGFIEFMVQYAHQLWNVSSLLNNSDTTKQLLAVELGEKLFESIKNVNEEKRLMLNAKHFQGNDYSNLAVENPEEHNMLQLLNQKIAENPNYPVPNGYKKVQDLVIEDSYQIPDALGINLSEKISMELLDELFNAALGIHILRSVPVTRTVTKVALDQNKRLIDYQAVASQNFRSQSQGSEAFIDQDGSDRKGRGASFQQNLGFSLKQPNHRLSQNGSKDIRKLHSSSPDYKSNNKFLSTPQILANKSKKLMLDSTLNGSRRRLNQQKLPSLRPELKLAVMEASPEEKENVNDCAQILEEMLQAVENGKTEDFSLVENLEQSKINQLRDSTASIDDLKDQLDQLKQVTRNSGGSQHGKPRYLSKYVSKKTEQRQKELELEKEALEKPISSAERKKRKAAVKDTLLRQNQFIEQQKKLRQEEKDNKQKELQQAEQAKLRAQQHRKAQQDKIKAKITVFNENKEKERQELKAKEDVDKKERQIEANIIMKRKEKQLDKDLKLLRDNVLKEKVEREKSTQRQAALPKIARRPTANFVRKDKQNDDFEQVKAEQSPNAKQKKPSIPKPVIVTTKSSRKASTSAVRKPKALGQKKQSREVILKKKAAEVVQTSADKPISAPDTGEERMSAIHIESNIQETVEALPIATEESIINKEDDMLFQPPATEESKHQSASPVRGRAASPLRESQKHNLNRKSGLSIRKSQVLSQKSNKKASQKSVAKTPGANVLVQDEAAQDAQDKNQGPMPTDNYSEEFD